MFLHLSSSSKMVLSHLYGCSFSPLFKLVEGLQDLGSVPYAEGFESGFNRNLCLYTKCEGIWCPPGRLLHSRAVGS